MNNDEGSRLAEILMQAPVALCILEGPEHTYTFANLAYRGLVNGREVVGKPLLVALPEVAGHGFDKMMDEVVATGLPFVGSEMEVKLEHHRGEERLFVSFTYHPKRNERGEVDGVIAIVTDITEQVLARRRVEALAEQLQARERQLRLLVEASGAGLWSLEPQTGKIESDPRMVELMSLPKGSEFTLASGLAGLPEAEDRRSVAEAVASALAGENEGRYRTEFRTGKPGSPRWVESRATASFDGEGKATHLAGAMFDITERKERERSSGRLLREVEAAHLRLRNLVENAPAFVATLRGSTHRFELVNAPYQRLVGMARHVLGLTVAEALPEVVGQGFIGLLDEVYRSGIPYRSSETLIQLDRDGSGKLEDAYVDFVYQPTRGLTGEIEGIDVFGYDITNQVLARKRAEALLAELEAIIQSLPDAFYVGGAGGIVRGNAAALEQLGFSSFDELNRNVATLAKEIQTRRLDNGELIPANEQAFSRALEGTPEVQEVRVRHLRTGQSRIIRSSCAPILVQGKVTGAVAINTDITERVNAELERDGLLALERAARADAEVANRVKDEFLATVSHELRTPLTAMLGWVQMIRSGALNPAKHERALETIERNARAQAQLIDDLLDVSRILTGKLSLEIQPTEVLTVVEGALESVRPAANAKGITLQSALDSTGVVMADAQRLQQVVWNLLTNAVKFTPKGGRVQVLLERRSSYLEISVSDTGQGIAPELLPHVFERFVQAEGGTSRQHGGLGLGLSIVKHLVEAHGGTAEVTSAGLGQGTTFSVRLPLSVAARTVAPQAGQGPVQVPPRALSHPPELEGLAVLVVDDEQDTREYVSALLESCGAQVMVAGSAAEALRALKATRPRIVVSDVGMPGEDGYAFVRQVRALGASEGGRTPVIALTAYASPADRVKTLTAGFSNHVSKPVNPPELLAVMATLVRAEGGGG